jgi:hypothetical protein
MRQMASEIKKKSVWSNGQLEGDKLRRLYALIL